jgi:hypothetical protein
MTDGLRLAALRLHSVGEADREWILDRLGRGERRRLVTLLRDLKRSGVRAAHADAVQHELATRPEPRRAEPAAGVPVELEQADVEAVARALRAEPEWVRSAILGVHPWKWRRSVLERIGRADPARRVAPTAAAPRPAVAAALARSLARRLAEPQAASPFDRVMDNLDPLTRPQRARIWQRVRQWIR